MSPSLVIHDTLSANRTKKRSSVLTCAGRLDATPIPPTLINSPYLSSLNSVFRRKIPIPKWPSQEDDQWLRDMVPVDRSPSSDIDSKSEGSHDLTPSPTSSDGPFGCSLLPPSSSYFPPSPMVRPCSTTPDVGTPAKRALCGSGSGSGQ